MPFSSLDTAAVARTLSQIAEHPEDIVDAYFERREEAEVPPAGEGSGLRIWREEGFAIRLTRGGQTWLTSRDSIEPKAFAEALRLVARVLPTATYPEPPLRIAPLEELPAAPELLAFHPLVAKALRTHHVGFHLRLSVRRHRRWLQVVGPRIVPGAEREIFYSAVGESSWGRYGALLDRLDAETASDFAAALVAHFRARHAPPPLATPQGTVILGSAAVAVLLHEAVAHALEADTLALGGNPEAAVGVAMAAPELDVIDDPGAAPAGVRRTTDDEGLPIVRRWLLRGGIVEQPLADAMWAHTSAVLLPGAGRRGGRHFPPGPRSTHLEILPGSAAEGDLLSQADGGFHFPEATRGQLDPLSGEFSLSFPFGRRIRRGVAAEMVGPCAVRGRVAEILSRVTAIGNTTRAAGAGWCAKGGTKLPVWATAPSLRIEGVEIVP